MFHKRFYWKELQEGVFIDVFIGTFSMSYLNPYNGYGSEEEAVISLKSWIERTPDHSYKEFVLFTVYEKE
jgi:hypothetical protein